jgi:hypothetical protein
MRGFPSSPKPVIDSDAKRIYRLLSPPRYSKGMNIAYSPRIIVKIRSERGVVKIQNCVITT